MGEFVYKIEEMPAVEQVQAFMDTLDEQQQREFLLMIQGAQMTMRLMDKIRDGERSA